MRFSEATAEKLTKLQRRSYAAVRERLVKFDVSLRKLEDVQIVSRYLFSVEFSRFFLKKNF